MRRIPYLLLPRGMAQGMADVMPGVGACAERCFPGLDEQLKHAGLPYDTKTYLSMCIVSDLLLFVLFVFIIGLALPYGASVPLAFLIALGALAQQALFPAVVARRRVADLERHLLPALQDMHVQLTAGIPLFGVLTSVADGRYGCLSAEMKSTVDRIALGEEQLSVLRDVAAKTPSLYLRRVLWQIANSMKSGADVSGTIGNIIENLGEEQIIQLERFGAEMNPLAMMYMLVGVITPSLAVTFLVLLASVISMAEYTVTFIFVTLYALFLLTQIAFVGIAKTKRPNLL